MYTFFLTQFSPLTYVHHLIPMVVLHTSELWSARNSRRDTWAEMSSSMRCGTEEQIFQSINPLLTTVHEAAFYMFLRACNGEILCYLCSAAGTPVPIISPPTCVIPQSWIEYLRHVLVTIPCGKICQYFIPRFFRLVTDQCIKAWNGVHFNYPYDTFVSILRHAFSISTFAVESTSSTSAHGRLLHILIPDPIRLWLRIQNISVTDWSTLQTPICTHRSILSLILSIITNAAADE